MVLQERMWVVKWCCRNGCGLLNGVAGMDRGCEMVLQEWIGLLNGVAGMDRGC